MNQKHSIETEVSISSPDVDLLPDISPKKRTRTTRPPTPLHCCIVDDHCDLVPFLIGLYRIRKLNVEAAVDLVHVDAHPDFSIPSSSLSTTIANWNDNDHLYSILEEEGGISEFLIPLLARGLFRRMYWIRSAWADQFTDGDYNFTCFNSSSGRPKVDLRVPYYIDEGDYTEIRVGNPVNLNLSVCQSSGEHANQVLQNVNGSDWILDICLDYFSTNNPFYLELFSHVENDLHNHNDTTIEAVDICQIVVYIIKSLPYRCTLDECMSEQELYDLKDDCWSTLNAAILSEDKQSIEKCLQYYPRNANQFNLFFREYLRLLSTATRELILKSRHLLLLPHHPVHQADAVEQLIAELKDFIVRYGAKKEKAPLCITIARSSDDGYTSPAQADMLQLKVLAMLRDVMHTSFGVEKIFEHDLTKEPIVKAHELFFTPTTRRLFL